MSGEAYEVYLKKVFTAAVQDNRFSMKEAIVHIAPRDMKYKTIFQTAAPALCQIEEDEKIGIGGFVLEDPVRGLLLDETLEEKLNRQKEWFYRSSGFTVEIQF